jgi:hypothetical protein
MAKKLLIIAVLIVVVAASLAAYLLSREDPEGEEGDVALAEDVVEEHELRLRPFHLSVVRHDAPQAIVTFDIAAVLAHRIRSRQAWMLETKLRDAFLPALLPLVEVDWPDDGSIDLQLVENRLRKETARILGEELFRDIVVRRAELRAF